MNMGGYQDYSVWQCCEDQVPVRRQEYLSGITLDLSLKCGTWDGTVCGVPMLDKALCESAFQTQRHQFACLLAQVIGLLPAAPVA